MNGICDRTKELRSGGKNAAHRREPWVDSVRRISPSGAKIIATQSLVLMGKLLRAINRNE